MARGPFGGKRRLKDVDESEMASWTTSYGGSKPSQLNLADASFKVYVDICGVNATELPRKLERCEQIPERHRRLETSFARLCRRLARG